MGMRKELQCGKEQNGISKSARQGLMSKIIVQAQAARVQVKAETVPQAVDAKRLQPWMWPIPWLHG
jgi:hypothetical protein